MINNHRDLLVWQRGLGLARSIYEATDRLPENEKYGLTSQMRRAAVSIPSNIAEGSGRTVGKEFARFLRFSRGSLAELETQVVLSAQLNLLEGADEILCDIRELEKMLNSLISSVVRHSRKN